MASDGIKVIAQNKKARHDYFIEETYEAGMALTGTEVKSIRLGKVNLKDCYADVKQGDQQAHRLYSAERLFPGTASDLSVPWFGQDATGSCQRQEALRQARRYGKTRCEARCGAGLPGAPEDVIMGAYWFRRG